MSQDCDNNCASCSQECEDRKVDFKENLHSKSRVKRVIGVVSGKGGVGKSLVSAMVAVALNRKGYHSAVLDADITGPSIPKSFGIREKALGTDQGIIPIRTKKGIDIMSINLLLENDTDPVVWRGPIVASAVKQFWSDVIWDNVDFMIIDMPPGTGDVPLTVFQSIPVDGIIVVTSPQELVSMIVTKAVNMAKMMDIPVIGLVENMSHFTCPDNGKDYKIFGESHLEETAQEVGLDILARIPIDPELAKACDKGKIEDFEGPWLDKLVEKLEKMEER
ncbi:MAG TPA: Mrp/NBP35 family ATP-binding protein [Clostridia bacterium]|nr:Mrp/NBP35 family ATP-binding protein [Clostridia bacterium]